MEAEINLKYIRVAEILENIETINKQISLHKETTKSVFMIRQYQFKRGEFMQELQGLLEPIQLFVGMKVA